jgi:hypothetical protein
MFPHRRVMLFPLPVVLSIRTLALIVAGISFLYLVTGGGHIAHAAHLAGGVAGYFYGLKVARWPELRSLLTGWRRRRRREPIHFPARRMKPPEPRPEPPAPEEPPSPELVDRILDKIMAEGIDSLSREEREILQRASRSGRRS